MARRDDRALLMVIAVGVAIVLAIWYITSRKKTAPNQADMELVPGPDGHNTTEDDEFQLIGVADEEPAFQIGFGTGPGLYGSGRATSEL